MAIHSRVLSDTTGSRLALVGILALALAAMLGVQAAGFPLETDHYKFWTKLVTDGGVQAAYSGTFPHTYAIYPPVNLYFYWLVGQVYRQGIDPTFDIHRALADGTLTFMLKVPGIAFHLLTAALIYAWVRQRSGSRTALLATAGYAFQPGIIFDIAVWGQPDSVHSFLVLLTVMLLTAGRVEWAGPAFALAALAKPQAWVLAPVLVFFAGRKYGLRRLAVGGLTGLGTAMLVSAPFFWYGTWRELLRLPLRIASAAPFVSANAHNLWWVLVREHASAMPDFEPTRFGVSYADLGLLLVAGSILLTLAKVADSPPWRSLPAIAAFQAFAFFMMVTKAHENHAFLVFPLLALVWAYSPPLRGIYLALSLTFLVNVVLHDPVLAPQIGAAWLSGQLRLAQWLNAMANLALLAVWVGLILFPSTPNRDRQAATAGG